MLISKQKLYILLDVINDKLVLAPNDTPIHIDPMGDLQGYFPESELNNLLKKLQDDEKVLKISQWPSDEGYVYTGTEKDLYYFFYVRTSSFNEYYTKVQQEPEYKNFKLNPQGILIPNEALVLKITYTEANDILINDFFQLARPDFDSENEVVFEFLYQHANKKYTIEEIGKAVGRTIGKSPHKIVENLGFTGDIKRIFMQVTKNAICFKNPITKMDLEKLGIARIKLPR